MAATNSVAGLTKIVRNLQPIHFGESSTKKRKRFVISFVDATNGIAVGGETNKLNVADLGVGLTVIDNCSALLVFTTSTGATVNIVPAVPSADGKRICTGSASMASTDAAISSLQTGQITVEGY